MGKNIEQKLKQLLEGQLEHGEKVLWADRPEARPVFSAFTLAQVGAGLATVFMLLFAKTELDIHFPSNLNSPASFVEISIYLFFCLFPLIFFIAPWRQGRRIAAALYAITDRQAISIRLDKLKPQITIYPYDTIYDIEVSGKDVTYGSVFITSKSLLTQRSFVEQRSFDCETPDGFINIKRPHNVADRLRAQLRKTRTATGSFTSAETTGEGSNCSRQAPGSQQTTMVTLRGSIVAPEEFLVDKIKRTITVLVVNGIPIGLAWYTATGVAGYLCGLSVILLLMQARSLLASHHRRTWPEVDGTIISSYIKKSHEGLFHCCEIEYSGPASSSTIQRKQKVSYQYSLKNGSNETAKEIVDQCPPGSMVRLCCNPHKPREVSLRADTTKSGLVTLVVLFLALLASSLWLIADLNGYRPLAGLMSLFGPNFNAAGKTGGINITNLIILLLFPAAGVSLLLFTVWYRNKIRRQERNCRGSVVGTVVGWRQESSGDDSGGDVYYPIVEYQIDGITYQLEGSCGVDKERRENRGAQLTVRYDLRSPDSAFLSKDNSPLIVWSLFLMGLAVLTIGSIPLALHRHEVLQTIRNLLDK